MAIGDILILGPQIPCFIYNKLYLYKIATLEPGCKMIGVIILVSVTLTWQVRSFADITGLVR
jgi:hypothetical protein